MLFSQKVENLTRTRNKALLAQEAKLGDNLKNWRAGRADKDGTKFWGPVIRLANACELNIDQTTDLLKHAQKPSFEELQYAQPDDEVPSYAEATREAIAAILRRSASIDAYSLPNYRHRTLTSPDDISEGDIIPREHLSDGQLIPIIQKAEEKKLRLEPKVFYVVIRAAAAALIILITILVASPAAREKAVSIVTTIIEKADQFIKERREPSPQPTEVIPTSTSTATRSLIPTMTPLPAADTLAATPVAIPSAAINIRSGPGTEYEILQTTSAGDQLILIGKNPEGTWWNVLFNGISGWVSGELVAVQNADTVPVVVDYPPPPSTRTPEPTLVTPTPPLPTATLTPAPTETAIQQNPEDTSGARALASFSQIIISAPGNLVLVQEASSSITIDAPPDVLPAIYTRVEGNTLSIGTTSSLQVVNGSIQYRLSTPNVNAITILGTGDVRANNLTADVLNLTSTGTGSIDIGALNAKTIFATINGTGNITISSGEVVEQNVTSNATGNFSAGNLSSDKATIQLSGTGKATVWVNSQLEATAIGTGIIEYYGLPTVNPNNTDLGKIQSLGAK